MNLIGQLVRDKVTSPPRQLLIAFAFNPRHTSKSQNRGFWSYRLITQITEPENTLKNNYAWFWNYCPVDVQTVPTPTSKHYLPQRSFWRHQTDDRKITPGVGSGIPRSPLFLRELSSLICQYWKAPPLLSLSGFRTRHPGENMTISRPQAYFAGPESWRRSTNPCRLHPDPTLLAIPLPNDLGELQLRHPASTSVVGAAIPCRYATISSLVA